MLRPLGSALVSWRARPTARFLFGLARPGVRLGLLGNLACAQAICAPLSGCVQASQIYPLSFGEAQGNGSVQVERIEGGELLVVVELGELVPPDQRGLAEYAVWLQDLRGRTVKAGALRYDRARRSGNLLVTTPLTSFTVQVTGERTADANAPSDLLLAQRQVTHH